MFARASVSVLPFVFAASIVLIACSDNAGGTRPNESDDVVVAPLQPGGTVTGPAGTTLSVPVGGLADDVVVTMAVVALPDEPLDDGLVPVGPALSVSSAVRAAAATDRDFRLDFPLPDGADPADLGFAVYFPEGHGLRHDGDPDKPIVAVVEAELAEDPSRLALELTVLEPAGMIVQLVAGAGFVSPTEFGAHDHGDGFMVLCSNRDEHICDRWADEAESVFDEVHAEIVGMGFRNPRLRTHRTGAYKVYLHRYEVEQNPSGTCKVEQNGSTISGNHGKYNFPLKKLTVCVGGGPFVGVVDSGWNDARAETARHEYFHATQYAYGAIHLSSVQMWFVEGTASLAESSTASEVLLDTRDRRQVDEPLDRNYLGGGGDGEQYRTQDFFAYLEARLAPGAGLPFLIDFLEEGARPAAVSRTIEDFNHPELGDLSDAYWAWARNQAVEETVLLPVHGTTDLHLDGVPCEPDDDVATVEPVSAVAGSIDRTRDLKPLTSALYRVDVDVPSSVARELTLSVTADGSGVMVRFYDAEDCGSPQGGSDATFVAMPDSSRSEPYRYYVLIGNSEYVQGRGRTATLSITRRDVDPGEMPTVELVSPMDGTSYNYATDGYVGSRGLYVVDVPLVAEALDGDRTPLTGSSVVWEAQDPAGSDEWREVATGSDTTATLEFDASRKTVSLRVIATDEAGRRATSQTVTVVLVGPPG